IYWALGGTASRDRSDLAISQPAWRLDRSYQWNYGHAPALPRARRVPSGPGGRLFDPARRVERVVEEPAARPRRHTPGAWKRLGVAVVPLIRAVEPPGRLRNR